MDSEAGTHVRRSGPLQWLAVAAGVAGSVGLVAWTHSIDPEGSPPLDHAEFLATDSGEIPSEGDWRTVRLPADGSTGTGGRSGWFRLSVPIAGPAENVLGLYLPLLRTNAEIRWNGREIARVGDFSGVTVRNWQVPVLVPVPRDLVVPGENVVHVRVGALPRMAALGRVWVGPHQTLREAYLFRRALKLTTVRVLALVLAFTAAIMSGIWIGRRTDTLYGLFALLLASFATYLGLFGATEWPVSERWWTWARITVLGWFVAFVMIVTPRFFDVARPWIERGVVGFMTIASVGTALLAALLPDLFDVVGARGFPTTSLTIGLYPGVVGFLALVNRRDLPALALLAAGFTLILFGLHDVLMVNHLWTVSEGYLVHYGAPLVAGAFAWMLLARFVDALSESEELNRELENRVAEKSARLERNYERMREIERNQALATERERLMSDIHDGIGSQLTSSLVLLESGRGDPTELRRALRAALDDLRLVVDSLEPGEGGPAEVLGMVRHRLGRRIEKSGITLEWDIADLPTVADFGPEKALHLARIVQEALTNAVAHARARRISVSAAPDPETTGHGIRIEVTDDGEGIGTDATRGRGLANMERRARELAGRLDVEGSRSGTTIRLRIPVDGE